MYMYMIGPLVYFTRATIGFMVAYLYLDGVQRPTRCHVQQLKIALSSMGSQQ